MTCNLCSKEIPSGSVICPECGSRQTAYTDPRALYGRPRSAASKKRPKSSVMNLALMIVILITVVITGFALTRGMPGSKVADIEKSHDRILRLRVENAPEEKLRVEIDSFTLMVTRFLSKYEGSPECDRVKALYMSVANRPAGDDGEKNAALIAAGNIRDNGRDKIIEIYEVTPHYSVADEAYGVSVLWRNKSEVSVDTVIFSMKAYDSSGTPVASRNKRTTLVISASASSELEYAPGEQYESVWFNFWDSRDLARVELEQIIVNYSDDSAPLVIGTDLIPYVMSELR